MHRSLRLRFANPWVVFLAAFAVMGSAAFLLAQRSAGQYAEYQIRTVTTMTPPDGASGSPAISRTYFGRPDGSRGVRTAEVLGGRLCTTTTYWDSVRRDQVTASDCVAMKTTTPLRQIP
jgi:hypothetical protein